MGPPQARAGGWPLPLRLRSRREFVKIQTQGRKFRGRSLTLMVGKAMPSQGGTAIAIARMGYTVSRRVGNAVARNRLRRLLKEMVRQHPRGLAQGLDHVVVAHPQAAGLDTPMLCRELYELLARAHAWAHQLPCSSPLWPCIA